MEQKKDGFEGQRAILLPRKIISKFCLKNPLINGAYITALGYYPRAKFHYRERTVGIDQHILIYNQEGQGWAEIDDKKYSLYPGDCLVIPAGRSNRYGADEKNPWTIYWAHFKGAVSDAFVNSFIEKTGSYNCAVGHNENRIKAFEEIYTNLERGYGQDNISYVNMSFMGFLSSFLFSDAFDAATSKENTFDIVNTSIEFMQKNLDNLLDLKTVAQHVNISASHYSFLFKKKTGFSPMEYLTHLKVQKACQYLQFTTLRIKEIALSLGIDDPYYFSRVFTKVMSISPKSYRIKHTHDRE